MELFFIFILDWASPILFQTSFFYNFQLVRTIYFIFKEKKHREGERENHGWCHSIYKEFCRSIRMFLNYSFYIYLVCLSEQCSNHDCNRRTSYFVCGKSFYSKRNFVNIFFSSFLNNATKNCFSILSPSGLTRRELSKK